MAIGVNWAEIWGPVWADVWTETPPEPQPEPEPQGQTPAGRKRKRRYFVEVDGQTFFAEDEGHARAILDRAAELAAQAAEEQAEEIIEKRVAKSVTRKVAPVKIKAPSVETSAPLDVRPYEKQIHEAYRRAEELAELRLLLMRQQAIEDEEEAILLLM